MKIPVLSVTVANYNYAAFLPRNIESILGQSFGDFELILIDNASSDDSVEVMQAYAAQDARIRVVTHAENEGMIASLRQSAELSRGKYRVPVDADDWVLCDDAFETQVELLEAHPDVTFAYPTLTMVDSDGVTVQVSHAFPHDRVLPGPDAVEAVLSFTLTHSGMMHRLDAYRRTAGYTEAVRHVADMLLGVRLCELGDVAYIDRSMYAFRQHGTNVHRSPQLKVARNEILTVIDEAFDGPLGARIPDSEHVRRRVVRRALVHLPTQYIFTGHPGTGWRLYLESAKVRPFDTVVQRRTLQLLARTVLGQSGYARLVSLVRERIGANSTGQDYDAPPLIVAEGADE